MTSADDADRIWQRLDVLEDLLQVLDRRAELVELIYQAADVRAARSALTQEPWFLSEESAIHVLDMSMRRMTTRGRADLAAEAVELRRLLGDQ